MAICLNQGEAGTLRENGQVLDVLIGGVLAGVVAGVFAFLAAWWLVEPAMDGAIALEEEWAEATPGHEHDVAPVSREVQRTVGLATGVLAVGVAGGLLVSVVGLAAAAAGLAVTPWRGAAWSAAGGGFAVGLLPALAYPANPPGVGDPGTTGERTLVFLLVVGLGLAGAVGAGAAWRLMAKPWNAAGSAVLLAGSAACAVIAAAPEVPSAGFPAEVLWEFRIGSLAVQAVLWAVMALVLWGLAEVRGSPGPV